MSKRKKRENSSFLLQGAMLATAGMITKIVGLVYRIPLNNILGDEGQGFYSVAFQIYSIALLLTSYSLPLAVSKLVSARMATGAKKNALKVLKAALLFAVIVGGLVAGILFFGAGYIAEHVMNLRLSMYALKVLAPCLFVVAIMGVLRGYFQGLGTMYPTAISQLLEQIVNAVVSIVGASYLYQVGKSAMTADSGNLAGAYGASGGTLGTLTGALTGLVFLLFVLFATRKQIKRAVRTDREKQQETYGKIMPILLVTIIPVILSTTVYNISQILDTVIFNKIMTVQGYTQAEYGALIGIFDTKYNTLINVPLAMANALGTSVIPSLTAALTNHNTKLIKHKIHQAIRFAMVIAIPSFVGYLVLARPIIDLLFNGNIDTAAAMMRLGSITVVFYCLSTVTNALLQGLDRMTTPVKNAAISLVVHLICLFLMLVMFKWNIYAVVAGNIIFSLCMCILNAKSIYDVTGYVQETKKTFLLPGLAAGVMGIITFLIHALLHAVGLGGLATIIAIFAAVISYVVVLVLIGGIDEKEMLAMPKGNFLVRVFRKIHLLPPKEDYEYYE